MDVLLPGLVPRSEALVRASRDLDRKRISRREFEEVLGAEAEGFRRLQEGFRYVSPGLFAWQDLLRPFAEIVPGCVVGGLRRFYETNTFWRVLEFPPDATAGDSRAFGWIKKYFFADGLFAEEEPLVFTLPFPFLFRQYSSGLAPASIAGLLSEVAGWLGSFTGKVLCFFEPGFGYRNITEEDRRLGVGFVEGVRRRTEMPVFLVTSFFTLAGSLDYLFDLPVDGFGVDLYANPLDAVLGAWPDGKVLLAGVLATDSTLVESPGALRGVINRIRAELPADRVYLTPSGPAELLPRGVLEAKITNLRKVLR
jgi:methionine synthase II (cobalamin-independent)